MLVVDINVILPCLVDGFQSPEARALLHEDPDWCLPSLWQYEMAHTLRNKVRLGEMSQAEAKELAERALELFGERQEEVGVVEALETALELGLSAYDAAYVALARRHSCAMVTMDKEILRKAPKVARGLG